MSTETKIQLDDGATTTLERWGDSGPVMLCVHGMTSSRKSWVRTAQHYSGRFRVYAYDQRGHGDSSGVNGPMTLERGVRDLGNVIDAIGEPVDVQMGHSWGGAVSILGGRRFNIRRVVAVDPMIRQVSRQWYDEYVEELQESFAIHGEERDKQTLVDYAEWPELDRIGKVHAVHTMTTKPLEGLRDENPPEAWDLRKTLEAYPKPILLAMAEESISEPEDIEYVRQHGGPNVTVRVLEGTGHNFFRTDFDRFIAITDEFLAATNRQ
ncbi:MAG: alpha/beta fold hydrolase [Vulcanimicrobiaceae bacterium]